MLYTILQTQKTVGQRIGRVCSCPVARVPKARPFFIDRKDSEIRNIRGKQQMNEAQRAKVMQIIDKHGRS